MTAPTAMDPAARQAEIAQILARAWWRVVVRQKQSQTAVDDRYPVERACANPATREPGDHNGDTP